MPLVGKRLTGAFGWWQFDPQSEALVQEETGHLLKFAGRVTEDPGLGIGNSARQHWLRFDAQLGQAAYPLLVEVRDIPRQSGERPLVWRLDHSRSAQLRTREGGTDSPCPSYEEWFAVDRFAIDALLCWPQRESTGVPSQWTAVSGGWRGTVWTAFFYRLFHGAQTSIAPPPGYFEPARPQMPQQWMLVEPTGRETQDQAISLLDAFRNAAPAELPQLVSQLAEVRTHLRSQERMLLPLAWAGDAVSDSFVEIAWLYADPDIITDRLHGRVSQNNERVPAKWFFELRSECLLGTIDRVSGAPADFPVSPEHTFRRFLTPAGLREESRFPTHRLQRFQDIVENAIWAWRDSELALPDLQGTLHRLTVEPAGIGYMGRLVHYGGTAFDTSISTAIALKPKHPDVGHEMAPFFSESHSDGTGTAKPLKHGWFEFDFAARAVVNRGTKQLLRFERLLEGSANPASDQVSLFRYEDPEVSYPIIVRRKARKAPYRIDDWIIDHVASAEWWRQDVQGSGPPPYGLWVRVDSYCRDSVMLWPDLEETGPCRPGATSIGGWIDGRWEPKLQRETVIGSVGKGAPEGANSLTIALDAEFPPVWHFRNSEQPFAKPGSGVNLDWGRRFLVKPRDVKRIARRFLSGQTYRIRSDGKAILYCCGYQTAFRGKEQDEVQEPLLEYCDEDVRVQLGLGARYGTSVGYLFRPRLVRTSTFARADKELPPELFVQEGRVNKIIRPGPVLWRRLIDALEGTLHGEPATRYRQAKVSGLFACGIWHANGGRVARILEDS